MNDYGLDNVKINLIKFFKKNKKNIDNVLDELRLDYEDNWEDYFYGMCKEVFKLFLARDIYLDTGNKNVEQSAFILAHLVVNNLYSFSNGLYNDLESVLYELRNTKCKKSKILTIENDKEENNKKIGLEFVKESLIKFYEKEKITFENIEAYFLCDYNMDWDHYLSNLLNNLNKCFDDFCLLLNQNNKILQKECIIMAKSVAFKLYVFFEKLKIDLDTVVFSGLFYFPEFPKGYKRPDYFNEIVFGD